MLAYLHGDVFIPNLANASPLQLSMGQDAKLNPYDAEKNIGSKIIIIYTAMLLKKLVSSFGFQV
ncbi:MAG: hypothetical protein AABZ13_10880, partial [Planctomycetota bacterium]